MRRILLAGLLFTGGCLSGATAPSAVAGIQYNATMPPGGMFAGDQLQINAWALDINGDVIPFAVTYASSNTNVATITTGGLITAVGPGTTTITMSSGGQTARVPFTIDGNVSSTVQVTPQGPTVLAGDQVALTAVVLTTLNNPGRGKSVNWSTADATKASVDATGNVSAIAATAGVAICATATDAPTVKGCTTVTVH